MSHVKRYFVGFLTVFMLYHSALAADSPVSSVDPSIGVLAGQFKKNGKAPLANGRLFIYNKALGPPSTDRYVRVPDLNINLDKEGKFLLQLSAGVYYLSAVKAPADGAMGPPPKGELIYFKMNAKKEIQPFIVEAGKKTNAGIISSAIPYRRVDRANRGLDATMIEGTVIDENGAPVENAVILVHMKPGIQEMASYVSERTGKDGKFELLLNDGGNFYLRVRSEYHGGAPNAGEFVNANDPKEQIALSLKIGEKLTGVIIKAKRQPEKGPLAGQRQSKP